MYEDFYDTGRSEITCAEGGQDRDNTRAEVVKGHSERNAFYEHINHLDGAKLCGKQIAHPCVFSVGRIWFQFLDPGA